MPQMSPILWEVIFLFTTILFLTCAVKLYFSMTKAPTPSSSFTDLKPQNKPSWKW